MEISGKENLDTPSEPNPPPSQENPTESPRKNLDTPSEQNPPPSQGSPIEISGKEYMDTPPEPNPPPSQGSPMEISGKENLDTPSEPNPPPSQESPMEGPRKENLDTPPEPNPPPSQGSPMEISGKEYMDTPPEPNPLPSQECSKEGSCKENPDILSESSPPPSQEHPSPPDGGWGWVVCAACMLSNGFIMASSSTFGLIYEHMRTLYAADDDVSFKTSFVGSCQIGVMLLTSYLAGILSDVWGIRQTAFLGGVISMVGFVGSAYVTRLELLYVTYGVMTGGGFGLIFSPTFTISGHYFKRRLGLVTGIITFGSSAFTVVLTFVIPVTLRTFGLQVTFLGYAGVTFLVTLATLTWIPLVKRDANPKVKDEIKGQGCLSCCARSSQKYINFSVLRNRTFVIWTVASAIARFGYLEPYFHLVSHVSQKLHQSSPSYLLTVIAAFSGVGKLACGVLSDRLKFHRVTLQQGAFAAYGVIVFLIPFADVTAAFYVMSACLGLGDALINVIFAPIMFDLVGAVNAAQAIGFLALVSIPFSLSAPAITGHLRDQLGSYDVGFHVTGVVTVLAAGLLFFVPNRRGKDSLAQHCCGHRRQECNIEDDAKSDTLSKMSTKHVTLTRF